MAERHAQTVEPENDWKECDDRTKLIHYRDMTYVVKFAAELLNKQELCPREKPAKHLFYDWSLKNCPCN